MGAQKAEGRKRQGAVWRSKAVITPAETRRGKAAATVQGRGWRLPGSSQKRHSQATQSHTKPLQSHLKATQSQLIANRKPHQSHTKAIPKPYQIHPYASGMRQ
jgi:hypothetical protein